MAKYYVIFHKGLGYTDEYYYIGGDDGYVVKNGYKTEDEAKAALRVKLKETLAGFCLRDFECSISDDVENWYEQKYNGSIWDSDGTSFDEYMTDRETANIDWLPHVPQVYSINEVEFDGILVPV